MTTPTKISFAFVAGFLLLVGILHLATLFITLLLSYFALRKLSFGGRRAVAVALFLVLVSALAYGFCYFAKRAYVELPKIANTTIQGASLFAEKHDIELPFTDYHSMRELAVKGIPEKWVGLGRYAGTAVFEFVSLLIGIVAAVSLFINSKFDLSQDEHAVKDNLYLLSGNEIMVRFRTFYGSFSTVMGAQLLISFINTVLTAGFLLLNHVPFVSVLIMLTFLCGLLPIIGNLISNTLIVGVALTISPNLAMLALAFLIVVHKLEYFLNSKIIGHRIKNPVWMTLLGLLLGEKLMGIPGMILAPVILHYIKMEASQRRVTSIET